LVVQFYEGGPSVHYDKRELRGRLFLAVAAIAGSNKWARRLRQCPTCDEFFIVERFGRYCGECRPAAKAHASAERVKAKRTSDRVREKRELLEKRQALRRRLDATPTGTPAWHVVEADIDRIGARLLLRRPRKSRKEQHRIGSAAITVVIGMPGQPAGPDPILQPRKKVKRMRNASSRLH
jgi:hypothetical protein